jgi:uncharacterized protein
LDHLLLKAVPTVTTDEGVFEAVISTTDEDREKDIVVPEAMVSALHKWNRPIPLAWNHSVELEDIIGSLDGASAKTEGGEVAASGEVDLDTPRGREAWRLMKRRVAGFSYGYMLTSSTKRENGGRTITGLDIFEVSVVPIPANNSTRVISTKAMDSDMEYKRVRDEYAAVMYDLLTKAEPSKQLMPLDELRRRSDEVAREFGTR